ncbi:GGDEF domain-containing protein [Vibrio fortis]|nr:GGDEF domain-containing protein [Vibrio fortis]
MIKNISKGSFYENKVIAFIDLNGFKKVNDAKGHDVGDSVLIGFSQILQRYTRVEQLEDVIVRYGGDEFLIFFNSRNLENINKKLIYINNVVTEHFKKQKIELCFSHGLSINHNNDIESAIKVADKAMYLAKTKFKEKYKR